MSLVLSVILVPTHQLLSQVHTGLHQLDYVLLKKNTPYDWSTVCKNAELKTALTTAPCLAPPDTREGRPHLRPGV